MNTKTKKIAFIAFVLCLSCWLLSAQDSTALVERATAFKSQVDFVKKSPDENIGLLLKARSNYKDAGDWVSEASCNNWLASCYFYKEDFTAAEKAAARAIEICDLHQDTLSSSYLSGFALSALIFNVKGYHQKAIDRNSLPIKVEKKRDTLGIAIAQCYQNTGLFYENYGDYDEAILYYQRSLEDKEKLLSIDARYQGTVVSLLANSYLGTGNCYQKKEQLAKALSSYQKSISTLRTLPENSEYVQQIYFNCYYHQAEVYLEQGQLDSALYYAQRAVRISQKFNVFNDAYAFQVLGKCYERIGQPQKALDQFDRAVAAAISEASSYQQFPQVAKVVESRSAFFMAQGQYGEALKGYQQGLQRISRNFTEEDVHLNPTAEQCVQKLYALDLISGKAAAFLKLSEKEKNDRDYLSLAYKSYQLATRLIQQIRQSYVSEEAKFLLAKKAVSVYESAIEVSLRLHEQSGAKNYLEEAFAFAENNKAIGLLESMNDEQAKEYAGLPDDLLQQDKDLNTELAYCANKLAVEKDSVERQKLQSLFFDLKEEQVALLNRLEKEFPRYHQLKYEPLTAAVDDLQKRLQDHQQGLLEYFIGQEKAFVFLIDEKQLQVFRIEQTTDLMDQLQWLRSYIGAEPEEADFQVNFDRFCQLSNELFRQLLEAPLAALVPSAQRLVLIPDDVLGFLPFELLLTQKVGEGPADFRRDDLRYLVRDYSLSYQYSANFLLNSYASNKGKNHQNFIGFVPSFTKAVAEERSRNCSGAVLYDLSCARKETEDIHQLLGGTQLIGAQANVAAFKDVLGYKIIHLATHACVDEQDAGQNTIFFTNSSLNSLDLYQMDIDAELVVLSACNTGTGRLVKGEGIMSLSRGFIHAGCPSTLMSLWSVNDCATAELMNGFYQQLQKGARKDEALQASKLNFIQAAQDPAAGHPYYWAPFTAFGDTRPIDLSTGFPWLYLLGGGVFVLLIWLIRRRR